METYKAEQDKNGLWYVDGQGLPGFYGGHLNPGSRFDTEEEAARCAKLCDLVYKAAYRKAQEDIRRALGIKKD